MMSKRLLILGMVCLVVDAKVFLVETAPGMKCCFGTPNKHITTKRLTTKKLRAIQYKTPNNKHLAKAKHLKTNA